MTREQSLDTFLRAANGAGLVGLYEPALKGFVAVPFTRDEAGELLPDEAAIERIKARSEVSHG